MKYISLIICVSFAHHIYSSEITDKKEPLLLQDLSNKNNAQSEENDPSAQPPREPRPTISMCYDDCSEEDRRQIGGGLCIWAGVCSCFWIGLCCPQICRR